MQMSHSTQQNLTSLSFEKVEKRMEMKITSSQKMKIRDILYRIMDGYVKVLADFVNPVVVQMRIWMGRRCPVAK